MNQILLTISTYLWVNLHILIPWLPTPKDDIPFIAYSQSPVGADNSRFVQVEWVSAYDLFKNINDDDPEPKYVDNISQVLDSYATRLMAHPPGKRGFFEWHLFSSPYINTYNTLIWHHDNGCKDAEGNYVMWLDWWGRNRTMACPWFQAGIDATYKKAKFIFSELKKRHVELDFYSTENETAFVSWLFPSGQAEAIMADPRYPELEAELGFHDLVAAVNSWWSSEENKRNMIRANFILQNRLYRAFYNSVYKALFEEYPGIRNHTTDYAKKYFSKEYKVYDQNGWLMSSDIPAIPEMFTMNSDLSYLWCGPICSNPAWTPEEMRPFPDTPWNGFLKSLNEARAIVLSNPTKTFYPTIASSTYTGNHPFYRELLYHLALTFRMNDGFVFWDTNTITSQEDFLILQEALKEIDERVSFADRRTQVNALFGWHDTQVKTCSTANKKTICRVTRADGSGVWTQ